MSKEITIKIYADPGHSWGCAKIALLKELGISWEEISYFSYVKGKSIYLEEDCDLQVLIRAIKSKGDTIKYVEKHTDRQSPIRSYERATPSNLSTMFNGTI